MVGQMKNQIITILMAGYVAASYAYNPQELKNASGATGDPSVSQAQYDEIAYLPQPGDGIKIIPSSQMQRNVDEINSTAAFQDEYKKNGFVKRKSDDAIQLLAINKHYFMTSEKATYLDSNNLYDSHVKQKLSQIKLAFNYHPISFIPESNILGFAVADTWVKEPQEGWTGIVEIFTDAKLGVCDYKKSNVKLNRASVHLAKESVSYIVNEKPTIDLVEGNDKSGYSYKVDWFDADYYHTLKCALHVYDANELKGVITLANRIDKD